MKSAKEIVAEAWRLTITHRHQLFWFGAIPSFFSLIFGIWYAYYQVNAYLYSELFWNKETGFLGGVIWPIFLWFYETYGLGKTVFLIICILIFMAFWFFSPMLCSGAIAYSFYQVRMGKEVRLGMMQSVYRFFSLLEMTMMKRGLSLISFFSVFSIIIRNLGPGVARFIFPIILLFVILGLIFLYYLSMATQSIMIRNKNFLGAIGDSFKLVSENFGTAFKILILFFLVEIRVLLNLIIIILLPIGAVIATGFLMNFFTDHPYGPYVAGGIIFLLLMIATYLTAILYIFAEAIWTVAFFEFAEKQNKDAISEDEGP